jgi:hypothetical protein
MKPGSYHRRNPMKKNKKGLLARWIKAEDHMETLRYLANQRHVPLSEIPGYASAKTELDQLEAQIEKT